MQNKRRFSTRRVALHIFLTSRLLTRGHLILLSRSSFQFQFHILIFLSRVSTLTRDIDIAIIRPSVCPSVRKGPVLDENGLTYIVTVFFHHTVAQSFQFYQHQTSSRNFDGVTPCGALNTGIKISRSRYYSTLNNSKMAQDIFTMADQQKVAYDLSNGAILNDLERPLTWFSRSRHSSTLNISEMAKDTGSYYGRRIGNRTQAFTWYTTFNDLQ